MFCVGFHKTGTSSLGRALGLLDYRVAGPFGVRNPRIADDALPDALGRLDGHDAFCDNPWPVLFRQLDDAAPNSRFILTERPTDQWLASVVNHFGGSTTPMREWIYGPGDPVGHEAVYAATYEAHNAAVRDHFADRRDDLLVIDPSTEPGWPAVCAFLGHPEPDRPFPHANPGTPMRTRFNRARGRLRRALGR